MESFHVLRLVLSYHDPAFFMATLHNLELGTEVLSILSVVNIKLSIGRAEFA